MELRQKRWHLYPPQPALSEKISHHLTLDPVIAQLLLNRGIRSLDQASSFLQPENLGSPNFPEDVLIAASELVREAIEKQTLIFVYGDYDVDGMTSTAIMTSMLKRLGARVHFMIPNRFLDGYGLSKRALEMVRQEGAGLLITLDCGISNAKEIDLLKADTDCKVLILDHHTVPDRQPNAEAILNPKFLAEDHALSGLCTAGIVYKFWEFYCQYFKLDVTPDRHLDLVALGTVADVAPLVQENRRLTLLGLTSLSARKRVGIRTLLEVAKFTHKTVSPRDIGFTIAPRLNAAGRLGDAKICVELMMTEDETEALRLATMLQQLNEDRRFYCDQLLTEALQQAEQIPGLADHRVIVLHAEGWHPGIIGIIASRIVETYSRPAVIISVEDGLARGSARSIGDVNIYEILKECQPFFSSFGGHKAAAGFSLVPDKIEAFKAHLISVAAEKVSQTDLMPVLDLECELDPKQLTLSLATSLQTLEPYGAENPVPLFYTRSLKAIDFKTVGNGKHLKVTFTDAARSVVIDAIGFGLHDKLQLLYNPQVELAFSLEINTWLGRESPQLVLVDIK